MPRFARVIATVAFVSVALMVDANAPMEVMDVFAAHCTLCHDVEDPPKGLRLDTQRGVELAISRGIVRPGRPDATQLLTRLALPDDNALLMPPLDTPSRPNAAEIAILRAWVADLPPLPTHDDRADDAPASPAPAEDVERLQALGAHVGMLHLGTTWLRVDLTRVAFPLAADALDRLQAVGSWAREINLAGSDITEDLGAIVGACPHVRTIDASRTPLTSLGGVADATELVVLNLTGSAVGDEAIASLAGAPSLSRLHVEHTDITKDALNTLRDALPQLSAEGVAPAGAPEQIGWTEEQLSVWRAAEALWANYSRGDWEAIREQLHEQWVGALADGRSVSSASAWQKAYEEDTKPPYVVTRHTPTRVRVVGDTAVLQSTYDRVPPVREPDAEPSSLTLTETFVSTETGWKAISTSMAHTPASEAPW